VYVVYNIQTLTQVLNLLAFLKATLLSHDLSTLVEGFDTTKPDTLHLFLEFTPIQFLGVSPSLVPPIVPQFINGSG
jgi:hypothetical protein